MPVSLCFWLGCPLDVGFVFVLVVVVAVVVGFWFSPCSLGSLCVLFTLSCVSFSCAFVRPLSVLCCCCMFPVCVSIMCSDGMFVVRFVLEYDWFGLRMCGFAFVYCVFVIVCSFILI